MGVRIVVRGGSELRSSAEVVYEFDQQRIVIGRGAGADVRIPQRTVSESHASIRLEGTSWVLTDEGSTNGTRVNGTRVVAGRPKPIRTGDVVELGGFTLSFHAGVPVNESTSADRTSALARRLIREVLDPAGAAADPPKLVVLDGPQRGRTLEIPPPPARLVIGRAETCDLALTDADASREHAEVIRDLDGILVRDLGSKNGILVNDRATRERRLRDRDELVVGNTPIAFEDPAESAIKAIEGQPDEPLATPSSPPAPAPPAAPASAPAPASEAAFEAEAEAEAESGSEAGSSAPRPSNPTARVRKTSTGLGADVIIYLLAAAVLLASIAGLVFLLKAD